VEEQGTIIGIDVAKVSAWLDANIDSFTSPYVFTLIAGGRSNLTYRVTDTSGRVLALRRPPTGHILPTAHDMVREHTLLKALERGAIPAPRVYGICTDPLINEHPFYLMDFVDGIILRNEIEAMAQSAELRAAAGSNLAHTLAELHRVVPADVGLGEFAKTEDYVARQLKRWSRQYEQMKLDTISDGLVEKVAARLGESIPDQQAGTIVHGDYRLSNTVIDAQGAVKAILDWEICTLGDPLADVGMMLIYWPEPTDTLFALTDESPSAAPGFASRDELLAAYAAVSPFDLSQIDYYRAFAFWRLACILQGVYFRQVSGAGGGNRGSVAHFPAHIAALTQAAAELLD
jgi:aminoglycoside phosphotransferase (APT) family kinase protein